MSRFKWDIRYPKDTEASLQLATEINASPLLARILAGRGILTFDSAKHFFNPGIHELHSPWRMKNIEKAAKRITDALKNKEKILVYGDYDVDGTTAVSLMYGFLSKHTTFIDYYIPDRYDEGYGVSDKGIDFAIDGKFNLIITLDCGIKGKEKIARAQNHGIDVIVCDHHLPDEHPHPAYAVLDQKQMDCEYPYKELTGCGIGFKLICALSEMNQWDMEEAYSFLDLVALSTACDIVPITGENRALMTLGLNRINDNKARKGIARLLSSVERDKTVSDLVFVAGPRINAAGRIQHASQAVELLLSDDADTNEAFHAIDALNTERKELDRQITAEILDQIASDAWFKTSKTTVVYSEGWSKGVIGIAASRVMETHYKPTIVLTESNGKAVGSARSVKDFDVHEALTACSDLLEQFGGHKYAAGMTLSVENIEAFKHKFNEVVSASIRDEQLIPTLAVDTQADLPELSPRFLKTLQRMAPFGPSNPTPTLFTKGLVCTKEPFFMGAEKQHVKLFVEQEAYPGEVVEAVGFFMADEIKEINVNKPFTLAYTPEENTFRGITKIQLRIKAIKQD